VQSLNLKKTRVEIEAMKQVDVVEENLPINNFQSCAREIIEDFVEQQNPLVYPPLNIQPSFYSTREEYENNRKRAFNGPIFIEKSEDGFTLHLCNERLHKLPSRTLEGLSESKCAA
jgi:hypothetical protein